MSASGDEGSPVAVVEVDDLFKSYGPVNALRGISFTVNEGEVFALLGANGAGKTTTLEILEGHRRRSGGSVSVLGTDPEHRERQLRERTGVVLQSAGLDAELTVYETVSLFAGMYPGALPVHDVITLVGLRDRVRSRIKTLSGGLRRRLDLAIALIGDPDLIFLDEPTTGFDPAARRAAWQLVRDLRGLGRTIVLTSHYMDEVAHLADRAVVLVGGQIVAEGTPDSLGRRQSQTIISFGLSKSGLLQLPAALRDRATVGEDGVTLSTEDPTRVLLDLCRWAIDRGIPLRGLQVSRPTLEDVYLQLTDPAHNGAA